MMFSTTQFYYGERKWHFACLGTGIKTTYIALKQAKAYCKIMGTPFQATENEKKYAFEENRQPYSGSIVISIPNHQNILITKDPNLVNAHVALLIELEFLETVKLYVNNLENLVGCTYLKQAVPLVRKRRHINYAWDNRSNVLVTHKELIKLLTNCSSSCIRKTTRPP